MERSPGEPLTSHANIQRIEKFEQPYTQEILEAMAEALSVTVSDLLTIDPTKDGEVIDLVNMIKQRDRNTAMKILRALIDETGTGTDG